MEESAVPSTAQCGLTDIIPYADWDSVLSMVLSLRIHLFEYGAIPTWNFMFCGGRPELAVPFSWAYAWPSALAYVLPPLAAVLALWLLLTAIGAASMGALLLRWTGSRSGALAGVCVYAFSGAFAVRFNVGHVTFAFYHLVPLLMLLFERSVAAGRLGERPVALSIGMVVTAFALMSGGLPHALLHMVPALLLGVAVRMALLTRERGPDAAFRIGAVPVVAAALGVWMAAYKIWPAATWQAGVPRINRWTERYSVAEIFQNTQHFSRGVFGRKNDMPWYDFSAAEHNVFVGPMPWVLALVAIALAARATVSRRNGRDARPDRLPLVLAVLSILVGVWFSLGNGHPMSPSAYFSEIPVLDAVRSFARFQILIVFGLSICTAVGVGDIETRVTGRARRAVVRGLLLAVVILPVLAQTAKLVSKIRTKSTVTLLAGFPSDAPDPPVLMRKPRKKPRLAGSGLQTALLAEGFWIENCYTNLELPKPKVSSPPHTGSQISVPPPSALEEIGRSSMRLRYPTEGGGEIRLNLRAPEGLTANVPMRRGERGFVFIDQEDLPDGILELSVDYPGPAAGVRLSLVGLAATCLFLTWLSRSTGAPAARRTPS